MSKKEIASINVKLTAFTLLFLFSSESRGQGCKAKFEFSVLNNLTVAFTDSSDASAPLIYFWDFDDNSPPSQMRNPIHTYQQPGEYSVKLRISNPNISCLDSTERRVRMNIVFPGDANDDGIINNEDVLYVGLAYGSVGPMRSDTTTHNFATSVPWVHPNGPANFHGGFNYQHADCDGNGVINRHDLRIIEDNYGMPAEKTEGSACLDTDDVPLYFEIPDSIAVGTTVTAEIKLGTLQIPADDVYGIAYTVHYSTDLIKQGTAALDYASSLFGSTTDILYLSKDFSLDGKLETAITRVDQNAQTITGTIGTLNFVMEDNLAQKTYATEILNLTFSDITLIKNDETIVPVCAIQDSAVIYEKLQTSASENMPVEKRVSIYPNPADQLLNIAFPLHEDCSLTMVNVIGKRVLLQKASPGKLSLDISHFPEGIYFIIIRNNETVQSFKMEISR